MNDDLVSAREWLRLGAEACQEWINPAVCDLPGKPEIGAFNWNFAIGIVGGSQNVVDFVADPDSFGDWNGGGVGDLAHELEGRIQIALCRGDRDAVLDLADQLDARISSPDCSPIVEEMYLGMPALARAGATGHVTAEVIHGRNESIVDDLAGDSDGDIEPTAFIDVRGLAFLSFAFRTPEFVNPGMVNEAGNYIPYGAITPELWG